MPNHAQTFRRLHDGPSILLLANAWDAGSARLTATLGASAIATTSAGVAWALGYPDGNAVPVEKLVAVVSSIARVVSVPLTVDAEGGYSDDPAEVGETIARLVDAGAVGVNIEDGNGPPALLAAKIAEAKAAATRRGVDLFVNARTDVYLRGLVSEPLRVGETLTRAAIYKDAGADGIFVPKVVVADEIREIASSVGLPLNVLAFPKLPPAAELAALGVRRLSAGSVIAQLAWRSVGLATTSFLGDGRSDPLWEAAAPFGEVNSLFAKG